MAGSCERGNELLDSVKSRVFDLAS